MFLDPKSVINTLLEINGSPITSETATQVCKSLL